MMETTAVASDDYRYVFIENAPLGERFVMRRIFITPKQGDPTMGKTVPPAGETLGDVLNREISRATQAAANYGFRDTATTRAHMATNFRARTRDISLPPFAWMALGELLSEWEKRPDHWTPGPKDIDANDLVKSAKEDADDDNKQ